MPSDAPSLRMCDGCSLQDLDLGQVPIASAEAHRSWVVGMHQAKDGSERLQKGDYAQLNNSTEGIVDGLNRCAQKIIAGLCDNLTYDHSEGTIIPKRPVLDD